MPGPSATRTALVVAIQARLQTQGYMLSSGQLSALLNDIESIVNANSSTVLADAAADLLVWPAPPLSSL